MSEWWTYTLTDFLLFSPRTYYRLFELYNAAVWPLQIVTLALGLAILVLMIRGAASSGRTVAAILAALWLLVAWAYLLERYDTINWAARYFAIAFVLQAALLVWTGLIRDRLRFESPPLIPAQAGIQSPTHRASERQSWVPAFAGTSGVRRPGLVLIVYALIIHPLVPPLTGRPWTQAEIFGLAPDPTAIATLGILLMASRSWLHLFAIPLLWCALTGLTLWTMESPEAWVAPALAATALATALYKTSVARMSVAKCGID
jgi:hypothetical protein